MAEVPVVETQAQAAKLAAETAKAEAETESARRAMEREDHRAEVEKAKLEAETRKLLAEAEAAEVEAAKKRRAEREELACNKYHHVFVFDQIVTDASVKACMSQLDVWDRNEPNCPIEIRFSSPGGSVLDGMALFDYIIKLRNDHAITCSAYGYAASMAGILLQAGTERVMGKESYILIHEVSTAVRGKIGEIEDEVKFLEKLGERIVNIFVTRATEAAERGTASKPVTRKKLKSKWRKTDWWLASDEALEIGIVDRVV